MSNEHDQTIADCAEAIRINPKDSSAYARRGAAYRMNGDYDRAIADCTEAIRLNPNEYSAFADRAVAYRMKGDLRRAIADFTEAKRLKSLPGWKKDDVWWAGKDWVEWNDVNKARIWGLTVKEVITLIRLKKISATTTVWKEGMGQQWAKAGTMPELQAAFNPQCEHSRTIADLTEVIRLNPKDNAALKKRGEAYRKKGKGNFDKAIADFTEAIRLKPDDAWAFAQRGESHRLNKNYDRAIADLSEAIRLKPDNAWAFACRGLTYRNKHEYDRAITDLAEAARLDSTNSRLLSSVQEEAKKKPSASWATGLYFCNNKSWYLLETDEQFVSLVKAKTITLDTFFVVVPNDLVPKRIGSHPVLKDAVQRILNQPSGFWSALKTGGKIAGLVTLFAAGSIFKAVARYDAAPRGMALCLKCKSPVDPFATRCPSCQGDPREF